MSVITGIKVGTTNVTASYTDNSSQEDIQSLEITSISLESVDSPSDCVYTGNSFNPLPSVHAIVNGQDTVLVKDTDYTLSYTDNTNVGTATVTATGINNYSGEVSSTWNITNADITVQKLDRTYIYDGYIHGDGITVSTVGNQSATIKFNFKQGTYSSTYTPTSYELIEYPQITNVSDSGVVYYQVSAPNHNTATGYYKLEIIPETAYLVWGDLSWTYDGKEHSTTCTVGNLIGTDVCNVILSGNSITDIGTTTVTATGLSNSNYKLPDNGLTYTLTVVAGLFVKLSGTWTPVKSVYMKVNGTWELQSMTTVFSTEKKYIRKTVESQSNNDQINNYHINEELD